MSLRKRMFFDIAKVESNDDGTLNVFGYASTGAKDSDGEIVLPEAMKAALPDYMKFGAVREMHQPSAAGTAIEASVNDDGKTWFGAHVVDPIAVSKVQNKVYKGFSVGGKVTERDTADRSVIKGIELIEVSLVDRPANPEAVFTMYKAERTPEDDVNELAALLDSGAVSPARVLELVKADKVGEASAGASSGTEAPASTTGAPAATGEPVAKGMYNLSRMAELMESLSYLCSSTEWEAQAEQDGSPIPGALRDWLKTGAGILQAMTAEELGELINTLNAQVQAGNGATVVAMAAKAEALGKAGARFSSATKAALAKVHSACKEAVGHLDSLKYADDDADADDAGKAAVPSAELSKAALDEAITKAVEIAVEPLKKENADLRLQVEKLGNRAAPGKALLKLIDKSADNRITAHSVTKADEEVPPAGTVQRAEWEMRKVFAGGGKRLAP